MRTTLLTLAVLCTAFAPVPLPRPKPLDRVKADLAALQGSWKLAWAHNNGVREEVAQDSRWHIDGDRLSTTLEGKPASKLVFSLYPRTSPPSIDLRNDAKSPVVPGRYRLDGDTLTISFGEKRPADLTGMGPCNGVWVMTRVRAK